MARLLAAVVLLFTLLTIYVQSTHHALRTFKYGGRSSTFQIMEAEFFDARNASLSEGELNNRLDVIAKKYLSTPCNVTYYNDITQTIIESRMEMCAIHKNSSTFYTLWDGFNVIQLTNRDVPDKTIIGGVPQPYQNNAFYIASRSAALIYDGAKLTAKQFSRKDEKLSEIACQFRVKNHPNLGRGVMIESVALPGMCLFYDPALDLIPALHICKNNDVYQHFLWSGAYLQSPISNEFLQIKYKVYKTTTQTKYSTTKIRTRYEIEADFDSDYDYYDTYTALTLLSVANNNYRQYGRILKGDPEVEGFYANVNVKVLENDTNLQAQLGNAYLPLRWSSANHSKLIGGSLLMIVLFVVKLLLL
ncbi:hypothetical protein ABK040_011595 [Willaertia magna]